MMTPNDTHGEDTSGHGQDIFHHPSVNRATASLHGPLHPNGAQYVTPANTHAPSGTHTPLHPNGAQYTTPADTHAPTPER